MWFLAIGWWKNPGVVILTSSNKAEYFLEIALLLGGNWGAREERTIRDPRAVGQHLGLGRRWPFTWSGSPEPRHRPTPLASVPRGESRKVWQHQLGALSLLWFGATVLPFFDHFWSLSFLIQSCSRICPGCKPSVPIGVLVSFQCPRGQSDKCEF